LLSKYQFDGDNAPVIRGSAIACMNNPTDPKAAQPIIDLMKALDDFIPEPVREVDKPFLMPVEDVFSIKGRGTVGTGRIERGIVKVGEEMSIIGLSKEIRNTVT